jgi:hypothetical protein
MRNLLFSSALLLISSASIAQLYVAPNGGTESYIYVKDQVLFVEQDVNLTENAASPDKKASIYLRDGSQLVQGTSNGTNSGNGYISVYQDSHSDAYDYNFWCSPVGNPTATGNQNFGVARFYDIQTNTQSALALHTGNTNGSSSPLTISRRWLYRMIPSTQRWSALGAGNNAPVGYGFTMKGTDVTVHTDPFSDPQNQVYDFRGRPNNGIITMPTQTGVAFTDGVQYDFTFTGNPYPSALDLNKVFIANPNIDSFKYWDEDRSINSHNYTANKGGYGTWIPGPGDPYATGGVYSKPTFLSYDNSGNPIPPIGGETMGADYARLYAPIGQGFMVMALNNAGITINNSHRVYEKEGAGSEFNFQGTGNNDDGGSRTSDISGSFVPDTPTIRIYSMFGESHYRDLVLMFDDLATDDYDRGMDASHPMDGAGTDAYFTIHGNEPDVRKNLVIQTVPFDDPHKMIPISFKIAQQMNVNVKAVEEINVPYLFAYLFDRDNNTYQLISDDPTQIADNGANMILPAGIYEDRFFITFRVAAPPDDNDTFVATNKKILEDLDFFQNNPAQQLEVVNKEGYDIRTANIFDMSGKLVYTNSNVGNSSRFTFPTGNLSDGMYIVMLTTAENIEVNYKISVQNR